MAERAHVVLPGWHADRVRREWPAFDGVVVEVRSEADVSVVLEAAADGAHVAAAVTEDGELVDQLLDGLRRIGPVRLGLPPQVGGPDGGLTSEGAAILGLLVQGSTLRQAAARLGLPLRTADRRLAKARAALGVATTAEAMVAYATLQRAGPTSGAGPGEPGVRLVGREREVALVVDALTSDEPVVLVGEGGVGKSALLAAVMAADGRPVHAAGAQAALRWKPYWPLARAVGKPELTGDVEAVAAQLEQIIGPDLLVVDDVHLADEGTVAVLGALSSRISTLAAARPDGGDGPGSPVGDLARAGFSVVAVSPLPTDAAAELARRLAPTLSSGEAARVAEGAGGLPLLVEFLCHGDETATRGRGLVPAVESLSPVARDSALRLALSAGPVPADGQAEALVSAGVATQTPDGRVRIRHALVADAVLAAAEPARITAAHLDLAEAAPDAGTAARHWWQAGDGERAHRAALVAAAGASAAGERAEHLRLAALAAPEADRSGLRLRAAGELSVAGRHQAVLELLTDPPDTDLAAAAEADVLRARAHWHLGDAPTARATARAGLARVAGLGTAGEQALLIEAVRCEALSVGPQPDHEAMLARAADLTDAGGMSRANLLNTEAIVAYLMRGSGVAEWTEGIAAARVEGNVDVLMRCSNNLISWHESTGDPDEGLRLAREMAAVAHQQGLGEWHSQFLAMTGNMLMHRGRFAEALAVLEAAEAEAIDVRTRSQSRLARAAIHTDLGLFDGAQALVGPFPADGLADEKLDNETRYQLAVLALYSGRPQVALDLLSGQRPDPAWAETWFALTVGAWAAYELGHDIPPAPEEVPMPLVGGMQRELEALHVLRSDPAAASDLFDAAVTLGRPWSYAPSVRALWAAGEARRLAAAPDAVPVLLAAEEEAATSGMEPILVRVRRSLRLAGVRRAAPRGVDRSGLVTERERAVLELVAAGATDVEIARRLGVGRPTVRRLIQSARAKLGTTDRMTTAAALAGR